MQVIPVSGLLLRRLHKLPAVKVLLVIVFLWLVAFEYCRLRYWRDPHSAFFDDSHVYEWKYSLYREHEGRHLISIHSAPIDPPQATKAGSNPLICAAFATVKRGTDDYFDASIGSLLEGLDPRERRALHLNVLFAGTDPTKHPSWGQKWVERLADSTGSYNVTESQFEHLRELEDVGNFYEKGIFDYIYALRSCQNTNAPYIAVFEDDIILAEGWMANTVKGLMDINHSPIKDPWVYLRLFYTETSLSWTSSDFVYRNMPLIFFSGMIFVFTALMVARRFRLVGHSYLDYPVLGVICLVAVPAFIALTYMIGKYSLMPMHGVVEMNSYGCCTQGLVFPTEQVGGLIDYLQERKAGQTDTMIEDYAAQTHLTRYALAPQQLQHVGLKSSRGNLAINTQSTWAFWFEENDPKTLRKEHEKLLRDRDVGWALDEHG